MLSMGVVLLVDGQLAAWLQLFLGVNDTDIIDDGDFFLRVPQEKGPNPIKAMPYRATTAGMV